MQKLDHEVKKNWTDSRELTSKHPRSPRVGKGRKSRRDRERDIESKR